MTYTGLAFPKPKMKKGNSRRAKNNPRPTLDDCCIVCGKVGAELHEIFHGPNRQNSIRYKMQVRLCEEHHRTGKRAVHNDKAFDLQLKRQYQAIFEETHTREEFASIFGRNYL